METKNRKTHKDYTIKETSEISKDDILAIDEALIDGWVYEVNSNQIYILANIKKNKKDIEEFYLIKPLDLGRGGLNLNWDNFSLKKKIMSIEYKNNKINAIWNGFYDKNQKKYVWKYNSDLINDGKLNNDKKSYPLYLCK